MTNVIYGTAPAAYICILKQMIMGLREIIKHAAQLIDVRTAEEYASGHIDGAVNIPLGQIPERAQEIKGLGETPVVFYCRSGNRSGQAVAYLSKQGYDHIYNGGSLEDVRKLLKHASW